jgi:vacuolar protein sorting-associated protein VTA1
MKSMSRYSKWKAADIMKALKEGRTPTPGGFGEVQDLLLLELRLYLNTLLQQSGGEPGQTNKATDADSGFSLPPAPSQAPVFNQNLPPAPGFTSPQYSSPPPPPYGGIPHGGIHSSITPPNGLTSFSPNDNSMPPLYGAPAAAPLNQYVPPPTQYPPSQQPPPPASSSSMGMSVPPKKILSPLEASTKDAMEYASFAVAALKVSAVLLHINSLCPFVLFKLTNAFPHIEFEFMNR